jgi:pyruvate,orthophosphate dikinase
MLESEALRVNLEETAVREIEVSPRYHVLREAVKDYQGVLKAADHLLFELHHPYRNWNALIGELRDFALKNLATYSRSSQGLDAIRVLVETFFEVISSVPKEGQRSQAVDGLLAFLQKVIVTVEPETLQGLLPHIEGFLGRLQESPLPVVQAAARSYHPLPRIMEDLARRLNGLDQAASLWAEAGRLLSRVEEVTLRYWLDQGAPGTWLRETLEQHSIELKPGDLENTQRIIKPVSHETLRSYHEHLQSKQKAVFDAQDALELARLPGHLDIVRRYREIAQEFASLSCQVPSASSQDKASRSQESTLHLLFLFHLVEMDGLSAIHEEILRQINRSLLCLVRTADLEQLRDVLPRSFALLKQQIGHFPRTALQCIEALGSEIFRRDKSRLTELFLEQVVQFGFQAPGIRGVDAEWQILCNPSHLQNIRVWLNLICQKPKAYGTLLSALIINLKLAGTCIKDTDLFQKDVSRLLNCDIEPAYNLVKQFAQGLPVYFNEIGAEGLLRDVSTEVDEISHRRDRLIHFLRKQSHVESNNLIVDFIEAILCFWFSRSKDGLAPFLPPEILEQVPTQGPYIDHVHRLTRHVAEFLDLEPFADRLGRLLNLEEERLSHILKGVSDVPPHEIRRFECLVQMYRLETLKYKLGTQEIRHHLEEARSFGFEGLVKVLDALDSDDMEVCLDAILDQLEVLKGIILSKEQFEIREEIYHKRHIAVDIPSMYGRYHERKFDALSLSFRLENLANIYFERLIAEVDSSFITRAIFVRILRCLRLFWRAVQLNGVHSTKFATYLSLLEKALDVRRFTFSQYLDLVRGLSEGVKDMIHVYYINSHQDNLAWIIRQLGKENLLPKYQGAVHEAENETQLVHRLTERFLRDLIAGTFGLQYLDNFVARVYQVLAEQKEVVNREDLDLLLSYNPDQILCPIHRPKEQTNNLIHLGNKGYNLVLLVREGVPVPPGVIVTTEVFRCFAIIQRLPNVHRDFKWQLQAALGDIERQTRRKFGDPVNPLLLSVRSGSAISMPGMMSTIINVGSNPTCIEGLAKRTGKLWFAWDNYRRFVQSWAMSQGVEREVFTELMITHKERRGVNHKREFTGEQMKELAMDYRRAAVEHGIEIIDDPFEQLLLAVRLVMESWESGKARDYREIMGISDYWGTAVIVQAMAFGNLTETSGTGVAFTANPMSKLSRVSLWGDFTPGNQGEDIVSGLVSTYPLSIEQCEAMGLDSEMTLEEHFPEIYHRLFSWAKHLVYEKKWNSQEIEFTFEGPEAERLFILQTRDMVTKMRETIQVFVPSAELEASYLGRGVGASGSAMTGRAVFTAREIEDLRKSEPDTPLILISPDTVPDDIKEISMADGLLTAKGGQTSHAAIVAFRLGKTCVVGCKQLQVFEHKGFAQLNDRRIQAGDFLGIDGRNGSIYMGKQPIQREEGSPLV